MTLLPTSEQADYRRALGAEIRERRRVVEASQEDLARASGFTQASISNYENGKRDIPVGVAIRITTVLWPDLTAEAGLAALLERTRRRLDRMSGVGHPGDRSAA